MQLIIVYHALNLHVRSLMYIKISARIITAILTRPPPFPRRILCYLRNFAIYLRDLNFSPRGDAWQRSQSLHILEASWYVGKSPDSCVYMHVRRPNNSDAFSRGVLPGKTHGNYYNYNFERSHGWN